MGGNLNIINQSGEQQKKGGTNFEIPVGRTKGGDTIFDANLLGGSNGNIYLFGNITRKTATSLVIF